MKIKVEDLNELADEINQARWIEIHGPVFGYSTLTQRNQKMIVQVLRKYAGVLSRVDIKKGSKGE